MTTETTTETNGSTGSTGMATGTTGSTGIADTVTGLLGEVLSSGREAADAPATAKAGLSSDR